GQALRTRLDAMMQISNGVVTNVSIFLVDDRTGLGTGSNAFYTSTQGSTVYVWPAASNWPSGAPNAWVAQISVGELAAQRFISSGGWPAWETVLIHESLHTQFTGEHMKWGSTSIVYGGDHMHYTSELCGEQELPFEEGLGTYYGDTQNHPTAYTNLIAFFARSNERYVLESRSVLAGTQAIWNAPHTERSLSLMSLPDPADRTGSYAVREYRWRDVPGFYLLFSESTTTGFNLFFWRTANNDPTRADQMIGTVARALARDRRKRYLTYEAHRLALQMEAFAATPQGAAARTAGTLTSSLYPFALLDVLTPFGM